MVILKIKIAFEESEYSVMHPYKMLKGWNASKNKNQFFQMLIKKMGKSFEKNDKILWKLWNTYTESFKWIIFEIIGFVAGIGIIILAFLLSKGVL